ncbi:hypothetical protein [Soonwooa sp.]|uniref:hypothetical protein n=1 Tax=Soonwooa sp. TaxID=1938592 RepID=UPI0028B18244|nr:hypothetical protein [Soonwooa sp.]
MRKQIKILVLLVFGTSIFSCRGDNGIDGKDGKDGANGQPGANGNANVIISAWKSSTNIKDTIIDLSNMKVATVTAPELKPEMVGNAAIFVYLNYGKGTFPLPRVSNAGGRVSTINFFPQKFKIRPTIFTHDNSNALSFSSILEFRYIIIPASTGNKNANQVDYNNYESVKKFYNLKD